MNRQIESEGSAGGVQGPALGPVAGSSRGRNSGKLWGFSPFKCRGKDYLSYFIIYFFSISVGIDNKLLELLQLIIICRLAFDI